MTLIRPHPLSVLGNSKALLVAFSHDLFEQIAINPLPLPIHTIQQLVNPGPATVIEDQSDHPGIMPQDQTQRATQTILRFAHISALINSNFSFRLNDLIRNSTLLASERLPISC